MKQWRVIAYSLAAVAATITYQTFGAYVQFFYIDVLGLWAGWVGVAMVAYGIWNAINDPLAGQISDRTRSRWGRRIPYIAWGSLPLAVCFALVWTPPFSMAAGQGAYLFAYFFVIILLFDTLYTFVFLNWTALFPEMFPDRAERARVSGLRQFFGIPGLILGVALAPVIYGALGWGWMGLIFGLIAALTLFVSLLGSREAPLFRADPPLPLRRALAATFGNRAFRLFLVANLCIQFTFVMFTATLPFFVKYVLGLSEVHTSAMLGALFLVVLPCLYLWTKVIHRFGSRRALLAALALVVVTMLPLLLVSGFVPVLASMAAIGVGLAGLLMVTDLLIADVVDEDELATGTRREGMYFGVNGFVIRLAVSVQSLVLTQTLARTGYVPDALQQPAALLAGLRLLLVGAPALVLVVGAVAVWYYPLDGARLMEVQVWVAALHGEKRARENG